MTITTSGKKFEKLVEDFFKKNGVPVVKYKEYTGEKNIVIPQYNIKDIFGSMSRVDFCYVTNTKKYYIECKCQNTPGSVDVKFPYYIENIRQKVYDGQFVFVLEGTGFRKNVLDWVKEQSKILDFKVYCDYAELKQLLPQKKIKPFVKWVGGKSKILDKTIEKFPEDFKNYYEPFLGGGSILFEMFNRGLLQDKNVRVSDINENLINCYNQIQNNVDNLLKELQVEKYKDVSKEMYLIHRKRYNDVKNTERDKVECAALFIYLNKCCFNGLYRENSSGIFNVPYGTPKFFNPDLENIRNLSTVIQDVNFSVNSFEKIEPVEDSFIYCDPPYHKTFSSYDKQEFDEDFHKKLQEHCRKFKYSVISNSDTDFVRNLYSEWVIYEINTKKSIGASGSSRISKNEVLIVSK